MSYKKETERDEKEIKIDKYGGAISLSGLSSSYLFGFTPTSSVAYSLANSVVDILRGRFRGPFLNVSSIYSIMSSSNPNALNEISTKGQELLGHLQFLSINIVQAPVDIKIGNFYIKKGERYIVPHINANAKVAKKITPIKKAKMFLEEFKTFCQIAREDEYLSKMPIVGRSHLARVFKNNADIQTEKVKGKISKLIGKMDSQLVSNMFGGKRKVSTDDITRFYIPAGVNPF